MFGRVQSKVFGGKGLAFKPWIMILMAIAVVALILSLALLFVKQWL